MTVPQGSYLVHFTTNVTNVESGSQTASCSLNYGGQLVQGTAITLPGLSGLEFSVGTVSILDAATFGSPTIISINCSSRAVHGARVDSGGVTATSVGAIRVQ